MMRRGGSARRSTKPEDSTRVNSQIRVPEVLVIGPEGEQIGVLATREALAQAEEQGLDLVEVAPGAKPPVCRMMDYGRYRYQQQKKQKANQKASGGNEQKELRMRPNTEDHDFGVKMKQAREFLSEGNRLKLTIRFRGRELAHREIGREMLQKAVDHLADVGKMEGWIADEGRNMTVNVVPAKGGGSKSDSDS